MDSFFAFLGAVLFGVILSIVVALLGGWILMVLLPPIFPGLVYLSYGQWFVTVLAIRLAFGSLSSGTSK